MLFHWIYILKITKTLCQTPTKNFYKNSFNPILKKTSPIVRSFPFIMLSVIWRKFWNNIKISKKCQKASLSNVWLTIFETDIHQFIMIFLQIIDIIIKETPSYWVPLVGRGKCFKLQLIEVRGKKAKWFWQKTKKEHTT